MKKITTIALATLFTLATATSASAGQAWVTHQDGNQYLMMTSKLADVRATVAKVNLGILCVDGEADPLRIMVIGEGMHGTGQVTYVLKVDDGPMLEPFARTGDQKAMMTGNSETRPLIESMQGGNTLLIGARDERNEVSVFKLSLAGFTRAFNGHIPARCLQ